MKHKPIFSEFFPPPNYTLTPAAVQQVKNSRENFTPAFVVDNDDLVPNIPSPHEPTSSDFGIIGPEQTVIDLKPTNISPKNPLTSGKCSSTTANG